MENQSSKIINKWGKHYWEGLLFKLNRKILSSLAIRSDAQMCLAEFLRPSFNQLNIWLLFDSKSIL